MNGLPRSFFARKGPGPPWKRCVEDIAEVSLGGGPKPGVKRSCSKRSPGDEIPMALVSTGQRAFAGFRTEAFGRTERPMRPWASCCVFWFFGCVSASRRAFPSIGLICCLAGFKGNLSSHQLTWNPRGGFWFEPFFLLNPLSGSMLVAGFQSPWRGSKDHL